MPSRSSRKKADVLTGEVRSADIRRGGPILVRTRQRSARGLPTHVAPALQPTWLEFHLDTD